MLPGTFLMSSGGRPTGQAPDDPTNALRLHSCQTLTPETEHTTHYFFQQAHEAHVGDDAVTEAFHNVIVAAFHEDQAMITAQSAAIERDPSARMVPIFADAALNQYRALVREVVEAERVAAAPA